MKGIFVFIVAVIAACQAMKRYDGYKVLQVTPRTEGQLQALENLREAQVELDFWHEPTKVGYYVDILVAPHQMEMVKAFMKTNALAIKVLDEDVQKNIDETFSKLNSKPENLAYDYDIYNTYEDFMDEVDALAADCPSDVTCTVSVIGQSFEERDIKMLHIDTGAAEDFWVDSCIHAREWLACATVMKIVDHMVRNSPSDDEADRILRSYNWYIVPIYNVDGYSYTFSNDRFWRKSRNENAGSTCFGTDLNRNHDHLWNTLGSSNNPCSDTFHGSDPSSEPETQAIEAAGRDTANGVKVWLSFHTYGYYWLVPFGDCSDPDNIDDVTQVTEATCDAIEANGDGTNWACGNSCDTLYATGGTTADWAMGNLGVLYSWTPELRGPGFNPPTSEIQPSFDEIWPGLVAKIDEIAAIGARKN